MYISVPARYSLGETTGLFDGTFTGTLTGDEGTSSTITAVLTHRDGAVSGTIQLTSGLQLDFPGLTRWPDPCKLEPVDLREFKVVGSAAANGRQAQVSAEVDEPTTQNPVGSTMKIKITIVGAFPAGDDNTLNTTVTMKPSLCGARAFTVPLKRKT